MKCKVRLSYSVVLCVEGKDEDEIWDWLNNTTPEGAKSLACYQNGITCGRGTMIDNYEECILSVVPESSIADYVIGGK